MIKFTTWDEWNDTLSKMNAGLVVCPDCNKWVSELHKIPEEYRHLSYRSGLIWTKERDDITEDERQLILGSIEREKEKTEYCCQDCISERMARKTRLDLQERFDYCKSCGNWVKKGSTKPYRKYQTRTIQLFCLDCVAKAEAEREFITQNLKEHQRVLLHNRRTAALGLVSDLTLMEWIKVIDLYGNKCADCGEDWTDLDHIIPVSKGGGTTKSNVRPLCGHCNSVKHDREL